jgi:hypothetical protein
LTRRWAYRTRRRRAPARSVDGDVDGHVVTAQPDGDGLGQPGVLIDHERVPGMLARTVRRGLAC